MVLLLPLAGEELAACRTCSHLGLRSHTKERSSYYYGREHGKQQFFTRCKTCFKQRARKPEYLANKRAATRAKRSALKADPEAWREYLDNQERYRENWRTRHPGAQQHAHRRWRQRHPDLVRMDRKFARERKTGERIVVPLLTRAPKSLVSYPIGPFRAWVKELILEERRRSGDADVRPVIAARLGCTPRRLYDYLFVLEVIDEAVVDRSCCREGSIHIGDLYPEYFTRPIKGPLVRRGSAR